MKYNKKSYYTGQTEKTENSEKAKNFFWNRAVKRLNYII